MDGWAFGRELAIVRTKGRGSRKMIGMLFGVSVYIVKNWEQGGSAPKHGAGMLRLLALVMEVGGDEEDILSRGKLYPAWVRCADFLEGGPVPVKSCKVARIKVKRMMGEIEAVICEGGSGEVSNAPVVEDFAKGGSVITDLDSVFGGADDA